MASGTFLLMQIFGTAALLLWGVRMARTAVMRAYGADIRRTLPNRLQNRFTSFIGGFLAAGVLQSSTAVAIFLSSIASLGAVPLVGGLAVMLGADVGSAAVAGLLALNIKELWPIAILAGYIIHSAFSETKARAKQMGRFIIGLGMVLAALSFMGQVAGTLAGRPVITFVLASLAGEPLLAVLVTAIIAWLAHSTMAVMLLLSSLAATGVITNPGLAVAAVLGANLGGGIPALVLTWRHAPAGRRIIVGNALFRAVGVVVFALFTGPAERLYLALPGDPGFKVVELHILFNLLLAVCFLGALPSVAKLLQRVMPAPPVRPEAEQFGPRYIPNAGSDTQMLLPLSALTRETLRMIDVVMSMVVQTADMFDMEKEDAERIQEVRRLDDRVDTLYNAVSHYAIHLVRSDMAKADKTRVNALLRYSASLENAGDIVDKSLLDIAKYKARAKSRFSTEGHNELSELFLYVQATMQMAAEAIMGWRADSAELLLERKAVFKKKALASSENHIDRLQQGQPPSIETTSFHFGILNDLQRIHTLVVSIAYDMNSSTFGESITTYESL